MSIYILVHGAWHGGWCWRDVEQLINADGHQVFTPTLTGLGNRAHLMSRDISLDTMIDDITGLLNAEDLRDVVLVGHSFAGPVITGAADREPSRIRSLIYLDASLLEDGEKMFSSIPEETANARRKLAEESSGGVSLPPPDPSAFGISDAEQAAYITERLTPHPISTYETPFNLSTRPGDVAPCAYIVCTKPIYAALQTSRDRAHDYGWPLYELATGHDAMISAPEDTAELVMRIGEEARQIY